MVNGSSSRSPARDPRGGESARDEAAERLLLSQAWNRLVHGMQGSAVQSDIRAHVRSAGSAGVPVQSAPPAGYRREVRTLEDGFVDASHPSREARLRSGASNVTLTEAVEFAGGAPDRARVVPPSGSADSLTGVSTSSAGGLHCQRGLLWLPRCRLVRLHLAAGRSTMMVESVQL